MRPICAIAAETNQLNTANRLIKQMKLDGIQFQLIRQVS
jgi:hypothetical protein